MTKEKKTLTQNRTIYYYYNKCLSIPLYPMMPDEDVGRVIKAVI